MGLQSGHAPANLAFVAVLTSSFALLAFSKYWRAQIAPIVAPYCIIRFTYWFLQIFTSPDFASIGLRLPQVQTYIAENLFSTLIFTAPSFHHTLNFPSKRYFVERRSKSSSSFCLMASNKGQSEPAGTCEKQGNCSFSLSIRCEARLAGACPCSEAIRTKALLYF